jgi:hypothetical protein
LVPRLPNAYFAFSTTYGPVNLFCVYAPTLTASEDNIDNFYNQMDASLKIS